MSGRLPLYTAQQLHNTPSIREDKVTFDEEKALRAKAVTFATLAGQKLHLNSSAIATAITYIHHFYMKFSFKKFDYFVCENLCVC